MDGEFTAAEVSRLAGFKKPWMLGHLEREGTFVREHATDRRHGRVRKYTFRDLLILRAINKMLELGARPARIRDAISKFSEIEEINDTRQAAEALAKTLGVRLFVSKSDAYLISSDDQIIDLSRKGQLAFGFMLDVHQVFHEVSEVVKIYSKKKIGNMKVDSPLLDRLCTEKGL